MKRELAYREEMVQQLQIARGGDGSQVSAHGRNCLSSGRSRNVGSVIWI